MISPVGAPDTFLDLYGLILSDRRVVGASDLDRADGISAVQTPVVGAGVACVLHAATGRGGVARGFAGSDEHLLAMVVMLKCFSRLGYFPALGRSRRWSLIMCDGIWSCPGVWRRSTPRGVPAVGTGMRSAPIPRLAPVTSTVLSAMVMSVPPVLSCLIGRGSGQRAKACGAEQVGILVVAWAGEIDDRLAGLLRGERRAAGGGARALPGGVGSGEHRAQRGRGGQLRKHRDEPDAQAAPPRFFR